jgi:hypothetical protein
MGKGGTHLVFLAAVEIAVSGKEGSAPVSPAYEKVSRAAVVVTPMRGHGLSAPMRGHSTAARSTSGERAHWREGPRQRRPSSLLRQPWMGTAGTVLS